MRWYHWHLLRDLMLLLAMFGLGVVMGWLFLACRIQP